VRRSVVSNSCSEQRALEKTWAIFRKDVSRGLYPQVDATTRERRPRKTPERALCFWKCHLPPFSAISREKKMREMQFHSGAKVGRTYWGSC